MTTLAVFGLGYSASATLRACGTRYARIVATVRSAHRAASLGAAFPELTVEGIAFDGGPPTPELELAIQAADHVLVSVPPAPDGDPVLASCAKALAVVRPQSIVYLSTVGAYGDHGGAWVDEATPPNPSSARSRARLAAEIGWQRLGQAHSIPVAILRLAGIYGPGQNALVNLAQGTARRIIKPGQVFNRIHVDDIAQAVLAAFDQRFDGIVNVADDEPSPPQDVVAYAATLLGLPVPPDLPFDIAGLSPMALSFYAENKRVRNARLRNELSVNLFYPDYRSALQALAARGEGRAGR